MPHSKAPEGLMSLTDFSIKALTLHIPEGSEATGYNSQEDQACFESQGQDLSEARPYIPALVVVGHLKEFLVAQKRNFRPIVGILRVAMWDCCSDVQQVSMSKPSATWPSDVFPRNTL